MLLENPLRFRSPIPSVVGFYDLGVNKLPDMRVLKPR
jgi:hypothetical protein